MAFLVFSKWKEPKVLLKTQVNRCFLVSLVVLKYAHGRREFSGVTDYFWFVVVLSICYIVNTAHCAGE